MVYQVGVWVGFTDTKVSCVCPRTERHYLFGSSRRSCEELVNQAVDSRGSQIGPWLKSASATQMDMKGMPLFSKGRRRVDGWVAKSLAYGSRRYPSSTQLTREPAASWSVPLMALSRNASLSSCEGSGPLLPRPRPLSPPRPRGKSVLRCGIWFADMA